MEATGIQRIQVTDLVAQDFLTLFFVQRCFLSDEPVQVILSRTVFKPALEKDTQIVRIMFKEPPAAGGTSRYRSPAAIEALSAGQNQETRSRPAGTAGRGSSAAVYSAPEVPASLFVAMPVEQAGAKKWKAHHVPLMCGQ